MKTVHIDDLITGHPKFALTWDTVPSLKLSFLGSPQVEFGGPPVQIERRKALALLAYLAVIGETCARKELATLLWPEHDTARALGYLLPETTKARC